MLRLTALGRGRGGGTTPSGPSVGPTWIATGAVGDTGAAPAYGTNAAGDYFYMSVAGRLTAMAALTGWTIIAGPNTTGGRSVYWLRRDTVSAGSESGTVSITGLVTGNSFTAAIHTFRNVGASGVVEDVSTDGHSAGGSAGTNAPDITAGGNYRLGVFVVGSGDFADLADDIAGESGGTWVLRAKARTLTGNDSAYGLYTAALDAGGTIAGGTGVVDVSDHSSVGFALVGV